MQNAQTSINHRESYAVGGIRWGKRTINTAPLKNFFPVHRIAVFSDSKCIISSYTNLGTIYTCLYAKCYTWKSEQSEVLQNHMQSVSAILWNLVAV